MADVRGLPVTGTGHRPMRVACRDLDVSGSFLRLLAVRAAGVPAVAPATHAIR